MAGEYTGGSGSGMAAPGARAADTVAAATIFFQPRVSSMAMRTSDRQLERFAPERDAAARSRSLGTLAFTDRIISSYMATAQRWGSPLRGQVQEEDGTSELDGAHWIFPRPWYLDELDWIGAARMAAAHTVRPPRYARASTMGVREESPALRPAGGALHIPLELVAPSFAERIPPAAGTRAGVTLGEVGHESAAPARRLPSPSVQRSPLVLRAWSPLVSFPSVQTAQLMADVLPGGVGSRPLRAERGGEASAQQRESGESVRSWPILELVAPRDLTPPTKDTAAQAAPSISESLRNRLAGAVRRFEQERATRAAERAPGAGAAVAGGAPGGGASSGAAVAGGAPRGGASSGALAAPRRVDDRERAAELLTRAALSGQSFLAPSTGPRLALPAGLGGLVAGMRAAGVVAHPVAKPASPGLTTMLPARMPMSSERPAVDTGGSAAAVALARVGERGVSMEAAAGVEAPRMGGGSAYRALVASRPQALRYLSWADRWLARFAGASLDALVILDATTGGPEPARSARVRSALAPATVFLDAPATAASTGHTQPSPAYAPVSSARRVPAAPSVPRMGDDDVVPDAMFAAIAAAVVRPPGKAPGEPAARVETAREERPPEARQTRSVLDELVRRIPVMPGPGMRVGLASSPVAPALAAVVPLPTIPPFDVRALSGGLLARAYLAGLVDPWTTSHGSSSLPTFPAAGRAASLGTRVSDAEPGTFPLAAHSPAIELVAPTEPMSVEPALSTHHHEAPTAPAARGAVAHLVRRGAGPAAVSAAPGQGPGATAVRAESWAVAREHRVADLAFDFVPPELVLAAQIYGFGPTEAAQALRLAATGATGLASLASAVDLALVEAFAEQHARQATAEERYRASAAADAGAAPARHLAPRPAAARVPWSEPAAHVGPAHPRELAGPAISDMSPRVPKGAFLWPQATALAMNLQSAGMDDSQARSLAALDVLAARAVAEMGAFVLPPTVAAARSPQGESVAILADRTRGLSQTPERASRTLVPIAPDSLMAAVPPGSVLAASAPVAAYVTPLLPGVDSIEEGEQAALAASGRPAGQMMAPAGVGRLSSGADGGAERADLLAAAAAVGWPGALPPDFEAVYVAMTRSPAGHSVSPAVRAARAMALVGSAAGATGNAAGHAMASTTGRRGTTARARAAAAWAFMPMVIPGAAPGMEHVARPSGAVLTAAHDAQSSPELPAMAARAGESLLSLVVSPTASAGEQAGSRGHAASSRHPAPRGAVRRVPTAAQPLVRTDGSSQAAAAQQMIRAAQVKRASGSPDIPPWFEEAARHLFEDSSGDGISLAEMTLVTAAPASQVAASPKTATASSRPPEAAGGSEGSAADPTADVEQLARDVYAEICRLIEVARDRNGDTWR